MIHVCNDGNVTNIFHNFCAFVKKCAYARVNIEELCIVARFRAMLPENIGVDIFRQHQLFVQSFA